MRLCGLALALVLALLACRSAPPPPARLPIQAEEPVQPAPPVQPVPPTPPTPPVKPVPVPPDARSGEGGITRRTVQGEKPIQQVMPFFSKPRPGQVRCTAWVVVSFTIAPSGAVESPAITSRCPEKSRDMDSTALEAIRQWRYVPRSEPTPSRVSFDYQTETPCDCPPAAP